MKALVRIMIVLAVSGTLHADDLLDEILAPSSVGAPTTSTEPAKDASKVPPAQNGSLLESVLAAHTEPATVERISPSVPSSGDLLDMTLDVALPNPQPRKVPDSTPQSAPGGETGMGEPLLLQTSNPTRLPGIENSVEDSNYAPSPEKSMPRKGFSDVLKRFKDKRGHGGQSVHFSRSAGHIENPTTFSIRGGGGDGSIAANLEYRRPLENSNFDLSFRGFLVETKQDGNNYYTYYRYTRWHWYYRKVYYDWEETQTDYGVESFLLWTPFRGRTFEPFAGIGARYESANYSYDESVRRGRSHESSDSGACLVGRLGLKLSLGKVFLTGEYIVGGKVGDFDGTSEFIGDVGFYLTQRMQMHLFVESLKMDLGSGTAFGGGLSFDF